MKNSISADRITKRQRHVPEPTWDIALLFPEQGSWSTEDYLALPGNHLVELSEGFLEILPMPTTLHQWIVLFLYEALNSFTSGKGGLVLTSPLPIQLWPEKLREPDVVFMSKEHRDRVTQEFWRSADLVMEVVSDDRKGRHRDLVIKRAEYAKARIPEYWIVDPKLKQITVLRLKGKRYVLHGSFKPGQQAQSHLLPGFSVDTSAVFAGPEGIELKR